MISLENQRAHSYQRFVKLFVTTTNTPLSPMPLPPDLNHDWDEPIHRYEKGYITWRLNNFVHRKTNAVDVLVQAVAADMLRKQQLTYPLVIAMESSVVTRWIPANFRRLWRRREIPGFTTTPPIPMNIFNSPGRIPETYELSLSTNTAATAHLPPSTISVCFNAGSLYESQLFCFLNQRSVRSERSEAPNMRACLIYVGFEN